MKDRRVPNGLRTAFLIHSLLAGLVGLQHVFAPRWWTDLAGLDITITVTWRVIGAAVLALAVGSWLAYREDAWARVRIVVIMEIVWSLLAALVLAWGIMVEGAPPLEWLNAALLACFGVVFTFFFLKMRGSDRPPAAIGTGSGTHEPGR